MSRIDEALTQRALVPGFDITGAAPKARAEFRGSEEPLDQYPRQPEEQPSPVDSSAVERLSEATEAGDEPMDLLAQYDAALEGKLVVSRDVPGLAIEQYRRLAAALHEMQATDGLKSLIVTSALPLDGKTLTSINLALTLSESYGRRVLLIDADLRRPSLHQAFRLPNDVGLGQVLRSHTAELPLTKLSKNLTVLTAGRSDNDPMAALTSDRMRSLLDECETRFDWVLLDAPPVVLLPDAQLLSRLTRAVIFVIGARSTPYAVVNRAIAGLGRECIVGTVLNRVEASTIPAATYYRRYYQHTDART